MSFTKLAHACSTAVWPRDAISMYGILYATTSPRAVQNSIEARDIGRAIPQVLTQYLDMRLVYIRTAYRPHTGRRYLTVDSMSAPEYIGDE